jgi:hypothetical protein
MQQSQFPPLQGGVKFPAKSRKFGILPGGLYLPHAPLYEFIGRKSSDGMALADKERVRWVKAWQNRLFWKNFYSMDALGLFMKQAMGR